MDNITIPHQYSNNPWDKHEGCKRTDHKAFNRSFWYKGFEVKRNSNVPNGADGLWEIPELVWFGKGGRQKGFLTVSMLQAREAIDKYMEFNV